MNIKVTKLEIIIIILIVGVTGTFKLKNFHQQMAQELDEKTGLKAKAALADTKESFCIYEYKTRAKITEKCPVKNWKPNQELIDYCLNKARGYNSPYSEKDCLAESKDSVIY